MLSTYKQPSHKASAGSMVSLSQDLMLGLDIPTDPIDRYINSLVDHRPGTKQIYRNRLLMLERSIGRPLEDATFDELCAALNRFSKVYFPSTYATCKSALRGFLSYIGRDDLVKRIPNRGSRWIPKRGPTSEQVDLLLEVADFRERVLILIAYSTGLRASEILGSRRYEIPPGLVENIDWELGLIRVMGKGGRFESVPFFLRRKETMRTLRLWLNGRTSGPIFDVKQGAIWKALKSLEKFTGVKLSMCLLRHSNIRSIRRGGGDIFTAAAQARHHDIKSTLAYEFDEPSDLIRLSREREWR